MTNLGSGGVTSPLPPVMPVVQVYTFLKFIFFISGHVGVYYRVSSQIVAFYREF